MDRLVCPAGCGEDVSCSSMIFSCLQHPPLHHLTKGSGLPGLFVQYIDVTGFDAAAPADSSKTPLCQSVLYYMMY